MDHASDKCILYSVYIHTGYEECFKKEKITENNIKYEVLTNINMNFENCKFLYKICLY